MPTNEPKFGLGAGVPALVTAARNGFSSAVVGRDDGEVSAEASAEDLSAGTGVPGRERKRPKAPAPARANMSRTRIFDRRIFISPPDYRSLLRFSVPGSFV